MIITDEQRKELENNQRYRDLCVMAVQNFAGYISQIDGTSLPGGMSHVDWAKERIIGKEIVLHPNNQNYGEWISQFTLNLKGADIWDEEQGVEGTVDNMVETMKFDAVAQEIYRQRMQAIQF